jgi:hypothetical protein
MARKTKEQILAGVHSDAISEFDRIQESIKDERMQCLQDRRFYSITGAQWEGDLGAQFENKPRFEVNKIHLSVIRIINEYRNNRITVNFLSKEGVEDDDLADTCDGLYRADEEDSGAEEAYDNAFEEAVAGGFGAWRLRTEYEDEEDPEDERQRICIEPIFDADSSVFFDLSAKRQDKADARKCFVLTSMAKQDYIEEYDDDPDSWDKEIQQTVFDWSTPDVVFIAEYYKVEEARETIHIWEGLDGSEERITDDELDDDKLELLLATGSKEVRQKKIRRKKIHKYIMSGGGVLEDCGYIAGSCIPVVPVYGKRWFVDNIERCMGHVRLAKDAQRLKNMQLSKLGEISAFSSVEKPLLTPEQVAGHETMWSEDNITNYPYLLINPMTDAAGNDIVSGPIGYTKPPQIPPAMAALLQITEEDMKDLLGNSQGGDQIASNIAQGTVELIQNRLDMQTYIYMSNMAKAMRRCGEVWLSMAKDVLVEEGRIMKALGRDGEMDRVTLMRPIVQNSGEIEYENDLSKAKFDVVVEVGPSSSTKRASTVRALTSMAAITTDPETKQVLGAMALMNMEGEGISDVRYYFRKKLIKMGVIEPTDQEAQQLAEEARNTPPSAQDEYLRAAAENEQQKAVKAQADTIKTQAQTDQIRAETAETITDIDTKEQKQAMEVIEKLGPRVTPPSVTGSPIEE